MIYREYVIQGSNYKSQAIKDFLKVTWQVTWGYEIYIKNDLRCKLQS